MQIKPGKLSDDELDAVAGGKNKANFCNNCLLLILPASNSLFSEEPDKRKSARDTQLLILEVEQESQTWMRLIKNRDSNALKSLIV
jgi:hypothetical protein